jgi:hypothetical protein
MRKLIATTAVLACSLPALAGQVVSTGAVSFTDGNGVPTLNTNGYVSWNFSGYGQGISLNGTAFAYSSTSGGGQSLAAGLNSLSLTAAPRDYSRTVTLTLSQNFNTIGDGTATASRTLQGTSNADWDQSLSISSESMHEGTPLPELDYSRYHQTGTRSFNLGGSNIGATTVSVAGVYSIITSYVFEIGAGCDWTTICIGDAVECASMNLTVVPLPAGAWAGIGGLGLVGGMRIARRRKLQ